jgi:hypothetical protein
MCDLALFFACFVPTPQMCARFDAKTALEMHAICGVGTEMVF